MEPPLPGPGTVQDMSDNLPAVPERRLETLRPLPAVPENAEDPQWVMAGFQTPSGVLLLASTTLTKGDFRRRMDGFDAVPIRPGGKPVARIPRWVITLDCQMRDFVQVRADNFPAAFRSLFEMWDPGRTSR